MNKKSGFTLAEVLVTLMIIGVIAAMTIPSLMQSTAQQEYRAAFKKAVSMINQAVTLNYALDGRDATDYSMDNFYNLMTQRLNVMSFDDTNKAMYTADGMWFRAYGQQDPVVKYRIEGMDMFDEMILDIKHDVVQLLMNLRKNEEVKREETARITNAALQDLQNLDADQSKVKSQVNKTVVNQGPKVGRNDPCPCGSGKKYKNCCGKNQ